MFWHCEQKISKTTRISQPGTIHKFKGNAYDELRSFRQRAKTLITLSSSIEKRIKSGNGKFSICRPFTKYYCSILRLKSYTMLALSGVVCPSIAVCASVKFSPQNCNQP